MCSLQLNVFYEFKKKVLVHHERFTKMIEDSNISLSKSKITPKIEQTEPKNRKQSSSSISEQVISEKCNVQKKEEEQKCNEKIAPKLLNKSPAAVPAKLQKKNPIKAENIDEDESYEKIVKYLQEHTEEQSTEMSIGKNIKEEYIDGLDDENLEILKDDNDAAGEEDIDSEYLEEFYLEEADALEANGDLGEEIKKVYDNCDSPTFSAIYLDEEFADNEDNNDYNDDDKYLMVETLDDFVMDDNDMTVVMKRKQNIGAKSKTNKRTKIELEEQTHVCTSCTMVFTKLSEYRNHL